MSFELPKRVKIGHINFDVINHYFDHTNEFWYGRLDDAKAQILINPELQEELKQDTLMHEIIHAMLLVSGYRPSAEEKLVLALTPMLCSLIKDNPELMIYLSERKDEELLTELQKAKNTP